jgi:phenylpropionate dioxygenase-like ring-hydroxylating dioxygenase large terminal subunit
MNIVPDQWYAVLDPAEVPVGSPVGRRRMGMDLVFWRDGQGRLHAARDRCPHRAAALSIGSVEDGCLTCPFHGFRFDSSGACVKIPAHPDLAISPAMRLEVLPVREAHDLVWAWSGPGDPDDGPIPFFDDAEQFDWRGSQFIVPWEVHYTRSVENQLDYAHLAFVHHNTIGRMAKVEVDVTVEVDGRTIRTHVEDGQAGIEFIGPNVWRLNLQPNLFNFLAFAPVDDDHMIYYLRTYQRLVRIPGLSWLACRASSLFNPVILRQDHRVVRTQTPRISSLDNGELYVKSDRALIAYLRWREQGRSARPATDSQGTARTG